MKRLAILIIFGLFLLIIPVVFLPEVSAQITGIPGLVNNIEIADEQAVVGDILSKEDKPTYEVPILQPRRLKELSRLKELKKRLIG